MKKYSQNDEESVILNYFKDYESGTFLSLGENDGETFSNVRALALSGRFSGVMVEPSPKAYNRLKNLYDNEKKGRFYIYPCAIGNKNGKVTLHESGELVKQGDVALVSTLVKEETNRFKHVVNYEEIQVDCYRWRTFLNRLTIKSFDFITIDIEGADADVLEQMDLADTKMLCLEWNGVDATRKRFLDHTNSFGISNVIYTSGENIIVCR